MNRQLPVNMVKKLLIALFAGISFILSFSSSASAEIVVIRDTVRNVIAVSPTSDISISTSISSEKKKLKNRESEMGSFLNTKVDLEKSHFTWGAEFGSSIDLTGHDLSTFDLDVLLGYKNKLFKTLGLGVGIHRTVQGGNNFIPIYALIRTSFTKRPSLLFMNLRAGYAFSTIENSPMFGDYNFALGCGVNLSQSRKAKTYLILNAGTRFFNKRHRDMIESLDTPYIWTAQLQFGVNF